MIGKRKNLKNLGYYVARISNCTKHLLSQSPAIMSYQQVLLMCFVPGNMLATMIYIAFSCLFHSTGLISLNQFAFVYPFYDFFCTDLHSSFYTSMCSNIQNGPPQASFLVHFLIYRPAQSIFLQSVNPLPSVQHSKFSL